jgi:nucleotide-binding universal stress UspA family protein
MGASVRWRTAPVGRVRRALVGWERCALIGRDRCALIGRDRVRTYDRSCHPIEERAMILIAYDGSDDAKAAITQAAQLFPGEPTTVMHAWQHFIDTMARAGSTPGLVVDYDAMDGATQKNAASQAREGAELARSAGLGDPQAVTIAVSTSLVAAILAEAEAIDARVIVLGSRGLGAVKAFFLGSVSGALLHHADRPVLVVPSPEVAAHRTEHLLP